MALDKNPIWSKADKSDVMGPSYSYADNIQGPSSKGVGSDGSFSQVFTNTGAIMDYVKYMISGPALGNQYFVNTGGVCNAPDGTTQPRYNYINNIANGDDLLPDSMKQDLSGIASDFNGLIPGILGDIEGLNPVHLFSALEADSTPSCECYTCQTSSETQSQFMTTSLSPDYDPNLCQKVDPSVCKKQGKESFTVGDSTAYPTIFALVSLGILTFITS